ncbi:hypothetical protein LZ30DRAFT_432913 [Colletotrichum cereale]|nr:hypothetical protein LZ30DRAFT_432913 [Colletotrichum cereale]
MTQGLTAGPGGRLSVRFRELGARTETLASGSSLGSTTSKQLPWLGSNVLESTWIKRSGICASFRFVSFHNVCLDPWETRYGGWTTRMACRDQFPSHISHRRKRSRMIAMRLVTNVLFYPETLSAKGKGWLGRLGLATRLRQCIYPSVYHRRPPCCDLPCLSAVSRGRIRAQTSIILISVHV